MPTLFESEDRAPEDNFTLRPYQESSVSGAIETFREFSRALGILPAGSGKTVVGAYIIKHFLEQGDSVLFLAHTNELCQQAADKLYAAIGITAQFEKAEQHADLDARVVVSSMQSMRERCGKFAPDHFGLVIVDEAHRTLGASYQHILKHFHNAKVLGLTATPHRGDKKNLGRYYETTAFEETMPKLIRQGYLSPINIKSIPLDIDLSTFSNKDSDGELDEKFHDELTPHLDAAAKALAEEAPGRKTIAFLPLVETAEKFAKACRRQGLIAKCVHGLHPDREGILDKFQKGFYQVLCNSMLLTEGWDCPSVDCVFILRLVRSYTLYAQMVGRGNRICTGKQDCLLLDPLYLHEDLDLIRPAHLVSDNEEEVKRITEVLKKQPRGGRKGTVDLIEAQSQAATERERKLREQILANKNRKRKSIDAMEYLLSIGGPSLAEYEPVFKWERKEATDGQLKLLSKFKIDTDTIKGRGHASKVISKLTARQRAGLATPAQVRFLSRQGHEDANEFTFEYASQLISSTIKGR